MRVSVCHSVFPLFLTKETFGCIFLQQQSTLERKKKNFTFSRKFPFVKSREDQSEDGSDQERNITKFIHSFDYNVFNQLFSTSK